MRLIDAATVHAVLPYGPLIEALRRGHREDVIAERVLMRQGSDDFLVWPAWQPRTALGVKLITVFPGNAAAGRPAIGGIYLLFDGGDGRVLAGLDGAALTFRKTAADTALGADYLARPDARVLGLIGAGGQAWHQVMAVRAVRPSLHRVKVWNRTPERAKALAARLTEDGLEAVAVPDPAAAVAGADVVACVTASETPLLCGRWLEPGTHVDLTGGYTPAMREADDETMQRAHLYVDTRRFALTECGDLAQPLAAGVIREDSVVGDLFDLVRGRAPGRRSSDEITVFKNGGGGHLDLMAALAAHERLMRDPAKAGSEDT